MSDEWLLKASDLEAQLQHAIKRNDELESFVQSVDSLIKTSDGIKRASVSTAELITLIESVKKFP